MRFLAISGSLRRLSANTSTLLAMTLLAPAGVAVELFGGLADLPAFSPDRDEALDLPAVLAWRVALRAADGVLISSPEYAHGVPGALKNALDWVVGSGELMEKPVGLVNVSPSSAFARPQLVETLTVMSARVVTDVMLAIPPGFRAMAAETMAAEPDVAAQLRRVLETVAGAVRSTAA